MTGAVFIFLYLPVGPPLPRSRKLPRRAMFVSGALSRNEARFDRCRLPFFALLLERPADCVHVYQRSFSFAIRFLDSWTSASVTVERIRWLLNKSSGHNDDCNLFVERVIRFNVHTCLFSRCSLPFVRSSLSPARVRNLAVLPLFGPTFLGVLIAMI